VTSEMQIKQPFPLLSISVRTQMKASEMVKIRIRFELRVLFEGEHVQPERTLLRTCSEGVEGPWQSPVETKDMCFREHSTGSGVQMKSKWSDRRHLKACQNTGSAEKTRKRK
jgi:hypothetical protein